MSLQEKRKGDLRWGGGEGGRDVKTEAENDVSINQGMPSIINSHQKLKEARNDCHLAPLQAMYL